MNGLSNLIKSLEGIISELNANGKRESALFFTVRYNEIIKHGEKLPSEIVDALLTCRAMSQYDNFSQLEESLLDNVVTDAIAVKNIIP